MTVVVVSMVLALGTSVSAADLASHPSLHICAGESASPPGYRPSPWPKPSAELLQSLRPGETARVVASFVIKPDGYTTRIRAEAEPFRFRGVVVEAISKWRAACGSCPEGCGGEPIEATQEFLFHGPEGVR